MSQVMLLVLIAVAAAAIDEESQTIYDNEVIVDARGWRGAAGWIIFVAGVALITEGIVLLLRFLNFKFFNNSYSIFGGLVRKSIDFTKLPIAIHTIGYYEVCTGRDWPVYWLYHNWN